MNTKLLRQKILDLAIRGKLTEQKKSDGTTKDLLEQIVSSVILSNAKNPGKSKNTPKEIIPLDKSEAPFEIPENWEWVRLPDICSIPITDGTHQTPTYSTKEDGVPFLSSKDVATQKIAWERIKYITKDLHEELYKRIAPRRNDILLAKNGTTGVAALVETDVVFDIYVTLAVIRPYSQIYPKYLLWVINSPVAKKQFDESLKGTGVPNLHLLEINKTMIPLPPLAEQQRIVTAIENAFAEITEIENNQELLKKHIKQGRQKILDLAIRGKLTQQLKTDGTTKDLLESIMAASSECHPERSAAKSKDPAKKKQTAEPKQIIPLDKTTAPFEIPENWEWVRLGDIGDWQSGTTPSKSNSAYYEDGTIPWLNTGDLNDGIVTEIPKMVTEKALNETSLRLNAAGSVCIAMYGATIGKLGILSVPATTNQACCVCNNLKAGVEKMWLFYFLMNHKKEFIEAGFGGAQPNISKEKIVSTAFPLPPLAEQQRIVATIEQAFAEFDAIKQTN